MFKLKSFVKPHYTILLIIGNGYLLTYLITYLRHGAESFLRRKQIFSQSRNSPHFMEFECSLPQSQEPATCPFFEPDQSSLCSSPPTHLRNVHVHLVRVNNSYLRSVNYYTI